MAEQFGAPKGDDKQCTTGNAQHVIAGHPVWVIVDLAKKLKVEILVIGATGHSAVYERLIGSRADRKYNSRTVQFWS
jgi:nucleotide-binding universal stress UspA family protein